MAYWSSVRLFILDLRVEPIIMLTMIAMLSRGVVMTQLMQDKLCQFKYHQSAEFCSNLSEKESSTIKDLILGDTSSYMSLKESVAVLPNIIFSLFAGSWCDRHRNGRRYVLLVSLCGQMLDTLLLLLNTIFYHWDFRILMLASVPSALMGNGLVLACLSFIAASSDVENRRVKFLTLEVFMNLALVVGFLAGPSIMLTKSVLFRNAGLRNFSDVFLMCILLIGSSIAWAYFRVTSEVCKPIAVPDFNQTAVNDDNTSQGSTDSSIGVDDKKSFLARSTSRVTSIFAVQDLKDFKDTLTKVRPDDGRRTLWIMIGVHTAMVLPIIGVMFVHFPYMERAYKWNSQMYGFMMALSMGIRPVAVALYTVLIVKRFKLSELEILILGLVSSILGLISIGSITNEFGFYGEITIGSLTGTGSPGFRSFLSLIVPANEITKVFSIMNIIDTVLPFAGGTVISAIFRATISSYPSLVYHIFVIPLIMALAVVTRIDVIRRFKVKNET